VAIEFNYFKCFLIDWVLEPLYVGNIHFTHNPGFERVHSVLGQLSKNYIKIDFEPIKVPNWHCPQIVPDMSRVAKLPKFNIFDHTCTMPFYTVSNTVLWRPAGHRHNWYKKALVW
jgi:hypothetical protein